MTKSQKQLIGAGVVVAGLYFLFTSPVGKRLLPSSFQKVVHLDKIDNSQIEQAVRKNNVKLEPFPSTTDADIPATRIRSAHWEWNAQVGEIYGVGGKHTKKGSLAEKFGVNIDLLHQDDNGKIQEGFVSCAKELAGGAKQCSDGYNMANIMLGGLPAFAATTNAMLKAAGLGPEWYIKSIGAIGRSNGEDGCWAPQSYKDDPKTIASTKMFDATGNELEQHGLLLEAVVHDDDYHICAAHAADNGIPVNPDEQTFDPNALNVVNVDSYITAATDYVSGKKCMNRELVNGTKDMGKQVNVCVNAVATWTPGDHILVKQRGGLVPVANTKQYLMPCVVVGPAKFFNDNRDEIIGYLAMAAAGGDQVANYDEALRRAAKMSVEVYDDKGDGDANGSYWYKYFKGTMEAEAKDHVMVSVGGSAVYGLEDELRLFGQNGANDSFASTYNKFAKMEQQEFPEIYKKTIIPPVRQVEMIDYLLNVKSRMEDTGTTVAKAEAVDYSSQTSGRVLGKASYQINFATGSDQPLPDGLAKLRDLKDSMASNMAAIDIIGYTDNVGDDRNPQANIMLSRRRAEAVKRYLQEISQQTFPDSRFGTVDGRGSADPAADNSTAEGRRRNRRVEIILHSNQ